MKSLIWKEWREIRLIPIAIAALFAAISLLWILQELQSHIAGHGNSLFGPYTPASALILMISAFLLSGVLSGAGLFANEIGSGSLAFLTMLPVARPKIWLAKASAGLIAILLSAFSTISTALFMLAIYSINRPDPATLNMFKDALGSIPQTIGPLAVAFAAAIGCFAIALTISLLVDRALASAVLSLVACIALPIFIAEIVSALTRPSAGDSVEYLIDFAMAFVIPAFLWTSYSIFVNGETLRTQKRFVLLGKAIAIWVVLAVLAVTGASVLHFAMLNFDSIN